MELARKIKTTGKVEIAEGAKKEAKFLYFHNDIVAIVEEHEIPPNLIMNLEQTPLECVPMSHYTMTKKGAKSVPIAGSTDKSCITRSLVITLAGDLLTLQLIYSGKTTQSWHNFLNLFHRVLIQSTSVIRKIVKQIKIINKIILPYVDQQREKLDNHGQAALLI